MISHICSLFCLQRSLAHLAAASKLPSTRGGTSSSSASPPLLAGFYFSIKSFKNPYCCGPTCLRMSGSMSFIFFDSGVPTTESKFSRTESSTKRNDWRVRPFATASVLLTFRSAEMHHGVVVFEHVHFFNLINRLHAYHRRITRMSTMRRATYRTS